MKKGLVTTIACLALVFSVTGCSEAENIRTIREVLQYESVEGQYTLEGEKVTIKNAVVNGSHGDVLTISLKDTYTTVEVAQKVPNPDIKIRTTVDVTGTVENYHGHCRIADAEVTTVDETRLSVYVTTGMTRQSQFDSFGRTSSGILADSVPLQIVSYNGITEFKEGTDSILTVCYQGQDPADPLYWLNFIVWGDTDTETLNYLNAYFFGNSTGSVVSWDDPFNYEPSHSEVAANWKGIGEGECFSGLFHFYYDEELDPDFGSMFYIDNICVPSLEYLEFYDEEDDLSELLDSLYQAYLDGCDEKSAYTNHLTYEAWQGDSIDKAETEGWVTSGDNLSPEFEEYLKSYTLIESEEFYVRVCASRYEIVQADYSYVQGIYNYDYFNEVLEDFTDESSGETYCIQLVFLNEESYNTYIESYSQTGEYDTSDPYIEYYGIYENSWHDFVNISTLYDIAEFGYSTYFHNDSTETRTINGQEITGDKYVIHDIDVIDALWNATTVQEAFGDAETWEDYNLALDDIFYAKDDDYLSITYDRDTGWYYTIGDEDTLFWSSYTWTNEITIGDNTIGSTVKA